MSVTGGVHFDLVKRVMRDTSRSGQNPEEIIQQITETVSWIEAEEGLDQRYQGLCVACRIDGQE